MMKKLIIINTRVIAKTIDKLVSASGNALQQEMHITLTDGFHKRVIF